MKEPLKYQNTYLVEMPVKLTGSEASSFQESFQKIYESPASPNSPTQVILDFSQTEFINSEGIGVLIHSQKNCAVANLNLSLWSLSPQVRTDLELAGLTQLGHIATGTDAIVLTKSISPRQQNCVDTLSSPHPSAHSMAKRFLDICGALVGLFILSILFIPVAIAIKLDSPGPIFFSQTRRGYMGRPFKIWKFRSMVVNASNLQHLVKNQANGAFFKNENDPRITRIGYLLRRTSLDEFPQFWNVLRGEMSLVGTRPPTYDEVSHYDSRDWQRLDVKPGITGLWQISGRSNIKNFQEVVQFDLQYQRQWSFLYDLEIVFKTVQLVFSKKNGAM